MSVTQILSIVIFLIVCLFLILLILLQNSKGGGLGLIGGGASPAPFGSSSMDILTRITWYFLIVFFLIAILAAIQFAEGVPEAPQELDTPLLNEPSTEAIQEPGT